MVFHGVLQLLLLMTCFTLSNQVPAQAESDGSSLRNLGQ